MFGATQVFTTQRLTSGVYMDYLTTTDNVKLRWEAFKRITPGKFNNKEEQLTYRCLTSPCDVQTADRILFTDKNGVDYIFVVMGTSQFSDAYGYHHERVIRQIGSFLHSDIQLWTAASSQPTYDPILKEYMNNDKAWNKTTISALVDSKEAKAESLVKILEEGKIESIDWVVTADLPTVITPDMKIVLTDNIVYDIKWVVPFPYENIVGLKKSLGNYAA